MPYKPTLLIVMDGWGVGDGRDPAHDAIAQAKTPVFDGLSQTFPYTTLQASGEAVGLPEGQMGNSEVGHMNIGAGRVVYQELTRIDKAIREGSFLANPVLHQACAQAKAPGQALHLLGLLSDGGVHSQLTHLYALLDLAKAQAVPRVYVHVLLDGRDTPPSSGLAFVQALEQRLQTRQLGRIATVSGRYYTMDRDQRWERVAKGYAAMVLGQEENQAEQAFSGVMAVEQGYGRGETDEFVLPTVIRDPQGGPVGQIREGDTLLMFNFRTDRMRQISHAFCDEQFEGFPRQAPLGLHLFTMTQYDATLPATVIFPPQNLNNTLGQVVSGLGLRQLRIAETEKYAHVTFFFNGGLEKANPGEDRILIPSPKVATYDLQPAMSAATVGRRVNEEISRGFYDLIILNYANPDMVGHTGQMAAAIQAVETVDDWVGRNVATVLAAGGVAVITADHGNAETMWQTQTNGPCTAHSCRPVPCILVGRDLVGRQLRQGGSLEDLAPTLLDLLDIVQPSEMTGTSLLRRS